MKPLLALLAGTAFAAGIVTPAQADEGPPAPAPASAPMPSIARTPVGVSESRTVSAPGPMTLIGRPGAKGGQNLGDVRMMLVTATSGGVSESDLPDQYAFLNCRPVGGSHPGAKDACAALAKVKGDPASLRPVKGTNCPMVYSPVTVTANGIWDGKYFWYRRTYGNKCEMRSVEGGVFAI
ncbi:SSI family serine proteinase inhibitor [Sphaerimonospora thailandensis]|uniref:Subtilisin inhibitor domain-containing protein n=1 Tax=Sphaerimonospora thailandensis TaxID=795644 RepID=A0A8J3RE39_9ACTN|nr:SSI family serine proteinase inhibitor [Sphaerimonospora thailandensis]GIH72162.1 hypothetical protein Mth01_44150 [Sphaerimonospora thailandensis]